MLRYQILVHSIWIFSFYFIIPIVCNTMTPKIYAFKVSHIGTGKFIRRSKNIVLFSNNFLDLAFT